MARITCAPLALAGALAACTLPAFADVEDRPFDFTDAFYLANGVNPAAIIGRPEPDGKSAVIDNNVPGPEFRNVRLLEHTACYDHSGHIRFFHVVGLLFPDTFTNDAAGVEARIAISEDWNLPAHSLEFEKAAGTDLGRQAMLAAAKGLAMTAIDLLGQPETLAEAKRVFAADMGRPAKP